jgi:hypothetical protein
MANDIWSINGHFNLFTSLSSSSHIHRITRIRPLTHLPISLPLCIAIITQCSTFIHSFIHFIFVSVCFVHSFLSTISISCLFRYIDRIHLIIKSNQICHRDSSCMHYDTTWENSTKFNTWVEHDSKRGVAYHSKVPLALQTRNMMALITNGR